MTTKRLSFQQQKQQQQEQHQSIQHVHHHHQQQQHQRRPPDVEEALSSMLWTPYERASTTDTSSDDDDELLLQRQLRKSKSQYDYTSVPTTIPPLTPPPLPTITPTHFPLPPPAPPTNIVAYITPAAVAATSFLTSTLPSTTSAYYTTEDLCDPSVTTPLVPFSNLMLNAHATASTTTASTMRATTPTNNSRRFLNTAINNTHQSLEYDATNEINDEDDDVTVNDTFNDDVYNNDNTLAATSSSNMMMMSSYQQKNHISYNQSYTQTATSFGRIPSLTKWWSNSSNTTSIQQPATSHHHHSNNFQSTSISSSTLTRPPPSAAKQTDDTSNKQPPSYESLYKKPHSIKPLRQRHQRLNKHLNLFKPVLETLKANVTTIRQGRFASLTRPDLNNRVTTTDNTTTTSTINSSLETAITTSQPVNVVKETITEIATTATTTATNVTRNENCSTESTTSNNLVHSFTDNFLHEHCPTTQHVAVTNVDNEHIINSNNTNNNNNTATVNINGEMPKQDTLIHQQFKTNEEQQQQIQNETNTKSKQNQEKENKQNNNFMIYQEQQNTKQLLLLETAINKTNQEEQTAKENSKRELIKMNPTSDQREPELTMNENYSNAPPAPTETVYKTKTNASTLTDLTASLFYDSSSAISLTRSFEANTSYTVGLTYGRGSFKTGLQDVRQQPQSNTYHLTPNKCLAELERLYAEFRASENLREQKLREAQNNRKTTTTTDTENMRLNVPANTTTQSEGLKTTEVGGKIMSDNATTTPRINPSTSSVFLTTTNSVTTITNPCQRTPSLTIQVNQNNNDTNNSSNPNNNNNTNNNINVNNIGNTGDVGSSSQRIANESQQIVLNQAIVNTTTNGVSVINCNYVNNNLNNNNNNNNNKSITNLCDNATNTTTSNHNNLNNNDHYKNFQNISKNLNDPNSVTNANSENLNPNKSDNLQKSPTSHSSVPQVLNVNNMKNDENDRQDQLMQNNEEHLKNSQNTQVKVIQINEVATSANTNFSNSNSTTPSSSPRRTFTSTECQTDDISSVQLRSPPSTRPPLTSTSSANSSSHTNNRDQRRRERRERRHLQHTASLLVAPTHTHPHPNHPIRHGHLDRHSMPAPPLPPILHPPHLHPGHLTQTGHNVAMLRPMLPDILHNHFPPPYSALPNQSLASAVSGNLPHHNGSPIPFSHPHAHPLHPPPQTPTATILGPPPPPPPAGTTLLTSVISTVPIPGATPMVSDGRFTLPLPIMRRSPSERSGKGCCGQWFAGPPLRALIAVVALGGVACALGGAALGATGLAGPPSSHFTAALLMIGVGVVLVTVSAVAWRMTAPGGPPCLGLASSVDLGRCGRRPCSRGGGAPQGLLYPEFQHRPPPPSYQASMQEYRLRLLLLDRDRQNGVVRGSSPPPTYRSHAGSLLRAPLTSTIRGTNGGQRCESSIGGSEYSFPPSYRSRNTTPGTISSERSIETEPSGRLLANEDIPEPLSVEQLSEYNSLQQRCNNHNNNNNTTTSNSSIQKSEQKRNSVDLDTNILISKSDTNLNSDKKDDLVTIVTITPPNSDNLEANENRVNTENVTESSESREQIEILAHL